MNTAVGVVLVVLAVLAAALVYWRRRVRAPRAIPFQEAVHNHTAWETMGRDIDQLRQQIRSEKLSDLDLEHCVQDLLTPKQAMLAEGHLFFNAQRSTPFLLRALNDPRFRQDRGGNPLKETPIDRVLNLLGRNLSPDLVLPLSPLVHDEDHEIRKRASLILAQIGTIEAIGPVRAALTDADPYVANHTMIGLKRGMEEERQGREFLDAVFDLLVPLLKRTGPAADRLSADCMLKIDRTKAADAFLDDSLWTPLAVPLLHVLSAANGAALALPIDKLLAVIDTLGPESGTYVGKSIYGQALISLARVGHPRAEPLIQQALESNDKHVAELGAEALAALNGLPDVHDTAFARFDEVDEEMDRLPAPLRAYLLVRFFSNEIHNGGYDQLYFNSTGDYAKEMVEALRTVGATQAAGGLARANALFGPDGPSSDREARQRQLERIADRAEPVFEAIENSFYHGQENVEKLLCLHAIRHKEHFRRG